MKCKQPKLKRLTPPHLFEVQLNPPPRRWIMRLRAVVGPLKCSRRHITTKISFQGLLPTLYDHSGL